MIINAYARYTAGLLCFAFYHESDTWYTGIVVRPQRIPVGRPVAAHLHTQYRTAEDRLRQIFITFLKPRNVRKTCDGMNTRRRRRIGPRGYPKGVQKHPIHSRNLHQHARKNLLALHTHIHAKIYRMTLRPFRFRGANIADKFTPTHANHVLGQMCGYR